MRSVRQWNFEIDELDLPFINKEPWMRDAACANTPVHYDWFFPDNPENSKEEEACAKDICADCPVISDCLDYAITNDEIYGIWGGMTLSERSALVRVHGGHTRPTALSAHKRHITELKRKKHHRAARNIRLRQVR